MSWGIKLRCYLPLGVFKNTDRDKPKGKTQLVQDICEKALTDCDLTLYLQITFSRPMVLWFLWIKKLVWIWLIKKAICKLCINQELINSKCGAVQDISFSSWKSIWDKAILFQYVPWKREPFPYISHHIQRHHVPLVFLLAWMGCDWQIQSWTHPSILERKRESERQQKHLPPCLISALHSVPEMYTFHCDWNIF